METIRQVIPRMHHMKIPFVEPWAYMLRPDRPLVWLQKGCLFVLHKLKAFRESERHHSYVTEISFESDKFMKHLFENERLIISEFNRYPKTLLVGRRKFDQFLGSEEFRDLIQFNSSYYMSMRSDNYGGRPHYNIHGLEVHVIPWMEGMLLLQGKYNPDSKER